MSDGGLEWPEFTESCESVIKKAYDQSNPMTGDEIRVMLMRLIGALDWTLEHDKDTVEWTKKHAVMLFAMMLRMAERITALENDRPPQA